MYMDDEIVKKKKGGVRNIEFIYIFDFLNW